MCAATYLLQRRVGRRRDQHLCLAVALVLSFSVIGQGQQAASSSIQFTQSEYLARIPENSVGRISATPDRDRMGVSLADTALPTGANVRFRIKSGDPEGFFKAEAERVGDFVFLNIRTRTSNRNVLNRERKDSYALDVRARIRTRRAGGGKRGKRPPDARAVVRVLVTDTNDLDPFFQPSSYAFEVPEDAVVHQSVGRVSATDADEGVNGEIYYSLIDVDDEEDPQRSFAVDPVTGVVFVTRPLSYRQAPRFTLTVAAQDRGPKPAYAVRQADTATVDIRVRQVRARTRNGLQVVSFYKRVGQKG